jgi:hypothetical protein
MLDFTGINYWAVLVVWLLYLGVGAYWYSTKGFAKQWTKHTGVDILKIPQDQANSIIISVAGSSLLQAFLLAGILNSVGVESILSGVVIGITIWLGFTAATTVGVTLYSQKSWKFLWLNASYFLVVMTIASAIYSVWQ